MADGPGTWLSGRAEIPLVNVGIGGMKLAAIRSNYTDTVWSVELTYLLDLCLTGEKDKIKKIRIVLSCNILVIYTLNTGVKGPLLWYGT